ncbi:glycosyltransferase family 2 protein [Synechococcus elongatus]|uniref:Glycosyltransferase n=1 Tax=Synechococcus elongatus PCC 11801 TaxID=2219813 RepID=A0AAN1QLJ5_SYNEL|nr:glycosyltransferase [Synechococcus elongatus]AZB71589.1 glycosyltransferase family 2 protein [Synechococcus elongatus PCC 11801]
MVKFSIVIPTRERLGTLIHTLPACLRIERDDVEFVVCDNFSQDGTADYLETIKDPRVRKYRTNQRLSMKDNFEHGLTRAQGAYLCFIGDDDLIIPYLFSLIEQEIENNIETVCWNRWVYYWPDSYESPNTLIINDHNFRVALSSKRVLDASLRYFLNYQNLPSLYNSFTHREVFQRVINYNCSNLKTENFYPQEAISPDVFSALQILRFTNSFVHMGLPFTVSGISKSSNGAGVANNSEESQKFVQELQVKQLSDLLNVALLSLKDQKMSYHITNLSDYICFILNYMSEDLQEDIFLDLITSGCRTLLEIGNIDADAAMRLITDHGISTSIINSRINLLDQGFYTLFRVPMFNRVVIDGDEYGFRNSFDTSIFLDNYLGSLLS